MRELTSLHPVYQTFFYDHVSGPIHTGSGDIVIHYHGRQILVPSLLVLRRYCEKLVKRYNEWGSTQYISEKADILPHRVSLYRQDTDYTPQKLDLIAMVKSSQRIVLVGESGSGKTTTMERLALEYSRDLYENIGKLNLIPLVVPLIRYTGNLRHAIRASLNASGVLQLHEDSLDTFLLTVKCFIMFDGINEVAGPQRDRIIPDIVEFIDTYPNHKFMVTSRIHDELWQIIPQSIIETRLSIQPIEAKDAIKYLCTHLGEQLGRFSYGELSWKTRELMQLPLILWMFKEEISHKKRELDANSILIKEASIKTSQYVPQNKGEMYKHFMEFVLVREKEKGHLAAKTRLSVKEYCLAELALEMQHRRTLTFRRSDIIPKFISTLKELFEISVPNELLEEIQLNGILVGEDDLSFAHQTFQEFFVATALVNLPLSSIENYINDPW